MTKTKKSTPLLLDRAARRAVLFAPIGVNTYGGQSWGGHNHQEEPGENPYRGYSVGEYVTEFKRRSRVNGEEW